MLNRIWRVTPLVFSVCVFSSVLAQTGAKNGEWTTYGGDLGNTRYAPLDQINASNFKDLELAWRFKTDNLGPNPEFMLESTPLVVNGKLYTTGGTRRSVIALNAGTGELLWVHMLDEGERFGPRQFSGRGLAYWTDGREERIVYVTPGYQMVALDAKSGIRIPSFGTSGIVDLRKDLEQNIDPLSADIGLHATPVIAKNVVIIGAAHLSSNLPKSKTNTKGYVRAFDVKTGKRLWTFHTIPKPGEPGIETWENDSWSYSGNAGVWAQVSVDEELGLAYLPVELPTGDYYGGNRPGNGLYGESLVAVDLQTGERKWHYQLVHHGLWDMDIPCAPILVDITVNGRLIKAVAQPTKQSYLYVFDRVTGQPVWPIEERPVEKGTAPGEWYSPTQPFPTKPPPYDNQGVTKDSLIDFTPELRAEAEKIVERFKIGPIFTPPIVSGEGGKYATLISPATRGGTNWAGGSFDPETHTAYLFSQTTVAAIGLVPPPPHMSDLPYVMGVVGGQLSAVVPMGADRALADSAPSPPVPDAMKDTPQPSLNVRGLPLLKPPYGRITAIDLDAGTIKWQIAHGETPDNVRNHPALKGLNIPRTGRPSGTVAPLTTKTLVIAGEGGVFTDENGVRGARLRAYDKATGKEVGSVFMPAPQTGSPMTYMVNGQQYIVIAVSGGNYSGEFLAFKLPSQRPAAPRARADN
jgi:quinoprotein glucose dehydrogenase